MHYKVKFYAEIDWRPKGFIGNFPETYSRQDLATIVAEREVPGLHIRYGTRAGYAIERSDGVVVDIGPGRVI